MKKVLSIVLTLTMVFAMCTVAFAAENDQSTPAGEGNYTVDTPFVYPVQPGSDVWAALDSLDAKIAACAVDTDLLESMTTEALLETVLNYPLLINIYAFTTVEEGLASVSRYFEGIDILLSREDAADSIQTALSVDTHSVNTDDDLVRGGFLKVFESKMNSSRGPARITTPGGSALRVYYNLTWDDFGTDEATAEANNKRLAAAYPNAVMVSGISPSYNCHSYAWYSTSTSNNCWIDDPNPYMSDGSYTKQSSAAVGYKVAWPGVYPTTSVPAHSAIVYSVSGTVKYISKWGYNGVYIHSLSDCPYSGSVSYWH